MPYIVQNQREKLDEEIDRLVNNTLTEIPEEKLLGAANYIITKLVLGILAPQNYSDMCGVIGTFESAKLECYRRLVGPYEDKAIEKNGDLKEYGL